MLQGRTQLQKHPVSKVLDDKVRFFFIINCQSVRLAENSKQ
jgi:hypothetical protein